MEQVNKSMRSEEEEVTLYFNAKELLAVSQHEMVELYLYSPSGPSWPVIRRTFTFTIPYQNRISPMNVQYT